MSIVSLSIVDGVATLTDSHGVTLTAEGVEMAVGDVVCARNMGMGWYLVVERDGDEVQRLPLRHNGWHAEDSPVITACPNPFLPPADPTKEG